MEQIKLYFKNKDKYANFLECLKQQGICLQDKDGNINPEVFNFDFILADEHGKEYIHTKELP